MRTFVQKRKPALQTKSACFTKPGRPHLGQSHEVRLILYPRRILLPSPSPLQVQPKLTVSAPGDRYEQEADRVAQQVMRMPDSQLQRACACGGGCSKCQAEQLSHQPQDLQNRRVPKNDAGETVAPPIAHKVLRSPGQPLHAKARAIMEPRFRYDFSKVRVHTDARSAESARAVNALAYTVGQQIVFGAGQYAPETSIGQHLLAHELTHVVQQAAADRSSLLQAKPLANPTEDPADPRFRRVPPGRGAYSPIEYREWQRRHPKYVRNASRTKREPQWFWDRGYFYMGRGGPAAAAETYEGIWWEVWLSNTGDGKELRLWHYWKEPSKKPPKHEHRERTQETPIPFEVADIRASIESIIKDNKHMDDLYSWLKNHKSDPQYAERYKAVEEWSLGWPYHSDDGPSFRQILEEEILDYMEGMPDEELPLLQRELERLQKLDQWRLDFYSRLNKLNYPSAPQ